jgi:hypothetical protein
MKISRPILNRPVTDPQDHITAADWGRIHRDYKGLSEIEVDGRPYRVRRRLRGTNRGTALVEVFLADRPVREAPREPEPKAAPTGGGPPRLPVCDACGDEGSGAKAGEPCGREEGGEICRGTYR